MPPLPSQGEGEAFVAFGEGVVDGGDAEAGAARSGRNGDRGAAVEVGAVEGGAAVAEGDRHIAALRRAGEADRVGAGTASLTVAEPVRLTVDIDGVGDAGHGGGRVDGEAFGVAAAGAGDGGADAAGVDVDVVGGGAATLTVPVVAPAPMVMLWPLERVTVTGGLRGVGERGGVTMLPPSATLGVADRLTVVTSATGSSVTVVLMVAPLATRCSSCRR